MQSAILYKLHSFYLCQPTILCILSYLFLTQSHMLCYDGFVGRHSGFLPYVRDSGYLFCAGSSSVRAFGTKRNNPWRLSWPLWSSRVISVLSYYLTSLVNLSFCGFGISFSDRQTARDARAFRHRSLRIFGFFQIPFLFRKHFTSCRFRFAKVVSVNPFQIAPGHFHVIDPIRICCEIRTFPLFSSRCLVSDCLRVYLYIGITSCVYNVP